MRTRVWPLLVWGVWCSVCPTVQGEADPGKRMETIRLPTAEQRGALSVEEAMARRESVREFADTLLTWKQTGQLLWAAQGVTRPWGGRTVPSAGALYPLEVYVSRRDGLYRYKPATHEVVRLSGRNHADALRAAALGQRWVREAPVVFVLCAVFDRIERRYGRRGELYVVLEAGHCAQNIMLQAVALGLGTVAIGAFQEDQVQKALGLPADHRPLYLIPAGHRRR